MRTRYVTNCCLCVQIYYVFLFFFFHIELQITNGRVWPLINCLCIFTAVMSSFLDNVTTVLLMTPVTIRLCEVMELNPVPILMSMIIYSNIGMSIYLRT